MPNTYLTGTNFSGILAENVSDCLKEIKDFALLAGWALDSGDYDNLPMVLKSGYSVSGVFAFYRFTSGSAGEFEIQGDIGGAGTSLSPATVNKVNGITTGSRLYCVAVDNRALAIYLKPASADGKPQVLGWLDSPLDASDAYAWGLWQLDSFLTSTTSSTRNKTLSKTNVGVDWNSAPSSSSSSNSFNFWEKNISTNSTSVFVSPIGGFPIVFRIPVAQGGSTDFGAVRGLLPLAVNGLMGASSGSVVSVPDSSVKYMCTGALQIAFQVAG